MKKEDEKVKAVMDYVMAMKRNALSRLDNGEDPEVIMIYADDCLHCHAQFDLFMRKTSEKHGLGVSLELVEMSRADVEKLFHKGKITAAVMNNKFNIIDKIIPVNKISTMGTELKDESKGWSKTTSNPDAVLDLTPMWLHYRTHQVIGVGHRAGKNLKMLVDQKKNVARERIFKDTYSMILGKTCTTVSCDPKAIVKINGKTYKKMG